MRTLVILVLILSLSCTKDTILFEQVEPEVNGLVGFSSDCHDVYGIMVSETEALVYTGTHSLYTDDDFNSLSYLEWHNTLYCEGFVIYYDGLTAWRQGSQIQRVSFEGKPEAFLTYQDYTFTPPFSFTIVPFTPYFLDDERFLLASQSSNTIDIYEANAVDKVGNRVGSTAALAGLVYPMGIFQAAEKWIMPVFESTAGTSVQVNILTSDDLVTWQGPFPFGSLDYNNDAITEFSGAGNLMVARVINKTVNPPTGSVKVSTDAGQTWGTPFPPTMKLLHAQVIDPETIFAVVEAAPGDRGTISKLAKSTDSGATWSVEEPLFYGDRINFFDHNNGLAMVGATLQITSDGGKSWKLVLVSGY